MRMLPVSDFGLRVTRGVLAKSSSMSFVLVFSCAIWASLVISASLARSANRSRAAISANRSRSADDTRSCSTFLASCVRSRALHSQQLNLHAVAKVFQEVEKWLEQI